jgi:hypothetical protein
MLRNGPQGATASAAFCDRFQLPRRDLRAIVRRATATKAPAGDALIVWHVICSTN